MALSSECEVHDWSWDPSDEIGCPICHGLRLAVSAIVAEINDVTNPMMVDREFLDGLEHAVDVVTDLYEEPCEGDCGGRCSQHDAYIQAEREEKYKKYFKHTKRYKEEQK